MRKITCCFTGNRIIPNKLYNLIKEKTEKCAENLILEGIEIFIAGGAIGYDLLCADIVLKLREKYPHIKLKIVLPCPDNDKYFSENAKKHYEKIFEQADEIIILSEKYFNGCMHKRNRYMVDNSSILICLCMKEEGGSFYTKKYAQNKNLIIYDLSPNKEEYEDSC